MFCWRRYFDGKSVNCEACVSLCSNDALTQTSILLCKIGTRLKRAFKNKGVVAYKLLAVKVRGGGSKQKSVKERMGMKRRESKYKR